MKLEDYIKNRISIINIYSKKNNVKLQKENIYKGKFSENIEYDKLINSYINIIKDNNTAEENELLERNLKTLKVTKLPILQRCFKRNYTSKYLVYKNKIILNEKVMDSLGHELLHVASTNATCKIIYSGFMKFDSIGNEIGRGLNEGFTELLTNKYFNKKDISSYQLFETNIASYLSEIIGFNKMKKFYFNASLESLIIELKKYDNLENIIKFIKNIDNIKDTKQILDCYLTLYKWRALDLKNKYNKNIITKDEYEKMVLDDSRIYPAKLYVMTCSTNPITDEMKEEVRKRL